MDEEEFNEEEQDAEIPLEDDFGIDEDGVDTEEDPLTMGFHEEEPESDY